MTERGRPGFLRVRAGDSIVRQLAQRERGSLRGLVEAALLPQQRGALAVQLGELLAGIHSGQQRLRPILQPVRLGEVPVAARGLGQLVERDRLRLHRAGRALAPAKYFEIEPLGLPPAAFRTRHVTRELEGRGPEQRVPGNARLAGELHRSHVLQHEGFKPLGRTVDASRVKSMEEFNALLADFLVRTVWP